jgi:uncharacterized phage protein gp47/JayE
MAFENKTVSEVRDLLINSFQGKFNLVFRILPKSFVRIIATVFAGVYITLYKQIGWLFLQLFPETAYWDTVNILGKNVRPLVKWGILKGIGTPYTGSQWEGEIAVSVSHAGSPLPAGTQLKSDISGKLYITEEGITLKNETETLPVICMENGTAGNLEIGDTLSFVNPLGNVKKITVVTDILKNGMDDETEGDYRNRVVNRYRMQPQGGSLADYRTWASEVPGVLNIYPYNDIDSPAGVLLYVSGTLAAFPDRIPSAAILIQVGEACTYDPETGKASRKPVTAVIDPDGNGSYSNVRAVEIIYFDIYITGLTGIAASEFAAAARPSIETYFMGREPYIRGLSNDDNKTNTVSKNNVSGIIDQIAVSLKAEFADAAMELDGETESSYTLGPGQLSELYRLFINGEEF